MRDSLHLSTRSTSLAPTWASCVSCVSGDKRRGPCAIPSQQRVPLIGIGSHNPVFSGTNTRAQHFVNVIRIFHLVRLMLTAQHEFEAQHRRIYRHVSERQWRPTKYKHSGSEEDF